ncbi:hypothetical protein CDD81_225 [Ophiocordyceps australis]|uniref:Rhodopsin domain-containing protein n=1 Tax=Ophiocordyceps australis TaxID=1399860 RepID=A0A2C5YFT7_9HYPO|nr:hypothetical protein CDD81_225 [Ophiocordyceps australis]
MWDVLFSEYSPGFLQTTTAATLTYAISITFSKLSILAFYLRISPDHKFRIAVFTLIGVVVAYTVTYIFVMVFRCSPVAAGWDLLLKGRCIDNLIPMMVLSIANILIDLVILCLPLKVVLPLQIPTRQKLSLVLLFATGGFVCAAAIKRTIIMPPLLASTDYTWNLTEQFIWSFIEVNAGILCASLAALKPLFMRYIPVLIVSRLRSSAVKDSAAVSAPKPDSKSSTVYGYELPSRDDLPAAKQPQRDDEARLWARGQKAPDAESMDGSEELYPGVKPPRLTVSHGAYGMQSGVDGVKVIKETHVSYPN